MITKIFEFVAKTDKAEKDVKDFSKSIEGVNENLNQTNKDVKELNKSGKSFDTLKKGAKGVAGGFKAMGTALKAAGIGLIIGVFVTLKELLQENQKVVDVFNIAFESLSLAFSDFFNFISKNIGTVTKFFKSIFENPLESVKALGEAIKNNIIERVKSALDVFGFLGKAMQKLFAGDFKGAINEVKNAGVEFADVLTGVDNSVEKVTNVVSEGVEAITEYTKSTVEAATANVELKKQAELAAVANQGLIEKFDRQAEQQRQIRDDERKSIEERKKANDELGLILEKQEKTMLQNAQTTLRAAQATLDKDKNNVESIKAVMEAENELAAVRAQVEGFRSEQLVNQAALEKEEKELINSKLESQANLSIEQKRFNAEQIEDNLQRLERQKEIDEEERELQTARLQTVIDNANAGTQAKIDAEIALNEFLQQAGQQEITRETEIAEAKKLIKEKEVQENDLANEKQRASDERLQKAKIQSLSNTLTTISNLSEIFAGESEKEQKRAFNIQKAVSISQGLISTFESAVQSYKSLAGIPVVGPGLGFAAAAAAVSAGLANVNQIRKQKFQAQGGGATTSPTQSTSSLSSATATAETSAPNFNVVGQSGFNQIADALGQQQPVQAFVVASEVTTQQQLDNAIVSTATLGN
tara:strand:+ start:3634 stop:5565 length:1932 start_codon:yes stop_codon:yes gene_type:complete